MRASSSGAIGGSSTAAATNRWRSSSGRRRRRSPIRARSVRGTMMPSSRESDVTRPSLTESAPLSTSFCTSSSMNMGCPPARSRKKSRSGAGTCGAPMICATRRSASLGSSSPSRSSACRGSAGNGAPGSGRAHRTMAIRELPSRAAARERISQLAPSSSCASSQTKTENRSSAKLCIMRRTPLRSAADADKRPPGVAAPSSPRTAATSSVSRPSARRRGSSATMRASGSPSRTPQTRRSMAIVPLYGS